MAAMPSNNNRDLISDYGSILREDLSFESLQQLCLSGGLRTSSVRSIVWRIFLKCLPIKKCEWEQVARRDRQKYLNLRNLHITDPHDSHFEQDPQENNPLTDAEQNPWQKFFADHSLRDIITKDVERTFPEIEFFQQSSIRTIMSNILLIYAKENTFLSYRQGMHEILAPLIFVLYSDQESFQHAKENGHLGVLPDVDLNNLDAVFDKESLEHDAYCMFCEMMLEVGRWYEDGEHHHVERSRHSSGPFMRIQDATPSSSLMTELAAIGDRLYTVDPGLASYLSGLDIPPQLYGIRWLRLLFGREFPIHDLLYLWDVIISDRPIPRMVECIFVCILVHIRELLMNSDYGGCLQYIMRYPPVVDISSFVQLARHFRNPKKVPRPPSIGLSNFANITITGKSHPNASKAHTEVVGYEEPPSGFRPKSQSVLAKVRGSILEKPASAPVSKQTTPRKTKHPVRSAMYEEPVQQAWEVNLQLMENQVACLQSRLNEKDIMCSEIALQIEQCARDLASATNEDSRQAISTRLRGLSSKLTSEFVRQVLPPSSGGRIDVAHEVRASVMKRSSIRKDNEMMEIRTTLLR